MIEAGRGSLCKKRVIKFEWESNVVKSELIALLAAKQTVLTDKEVEIGVSRIFDYLAQALSAGHRVELRSFGSFQVRFRRSRLARNPKTGERVMAASKYVVHFKPSKALRQLVCSSARADRPGTASSI